MSSSAGVSHRAPAGHGQPPGRRLPR